MTQIDNAKNMLPGFYQTPGVKGLLMLKRVQDHVVGFWFYQRKMYVFRFLGDLFRGEHFIKKLPHKPNFSWVGSYSHRGGGNVAILEWTKPRAFELAIGPTDRLEFKGWRPFFFTRTADGERIKAAQRHIDAYLARIKRQREGLIEIPLSNGGAIFIPRKKIRLINSSTASQVTSPRAAARA